MEKIEKTDRGIIEVLQGHEWQAESQRRAVCPQDQN